MKDDFCVHPYRPFQDVQDRSSLQRTISIVDEHIVNHTTVCVVVCDGGDSEGEEALGEGLCVSDCEGEAGW